MYTPFGKLEVTLPNGQTQEFGLAKASIIIGRAATNDITLADTEVSRAHVRLECSEEECVVVDLGSTNGTLVNGLRTQRARLLAGDKIAIGGSKLLFKGAGSENDFEKTQMHVGVDLERTIRELPVEVQIDETSEPRLVVISGGKTREFALTGDALKIGRDLNNDVVLESADVSRNHVVVKRRGRSFILSDLHSSNGTWINGQRITDHTLQPGDTFRVGTINIVFKAGFEGDDLTMRAPVMLARGERRPVILIPGIMGSKLRRGSDAIWPNVKALFSDPRVLGWCQDDPVISDGVLDQLVVVPNLIKVEAYSRLMEYLEEGLGYQRGKDLFEFGYDFRQDVRTSARLLAKKIEGLGLRQGVTLIAHSLGCLVSRYYVECLGGAKKTRKLILMGGPHYGSPRALMTIVLGPRILPFGLMDAQLRNVTASFPGMYQGLPAYPCVTDQYGKIVDLMHDESWLPESQRPYLRMARDLREELGTKCSVPAVSIFGYSIKTITSVTAERDSSGLFQKLELNVEPGGDDSMPESTGLLEGTEIHPVRQHHAALHIDGDVKMRLKLELTR